MSLDQVIQIAGALLILTGFVLSQRGRLEGSSYPYLLLNLAGGVILAILAWRDQRWGFVLLEGVWTLVAVAGLIMHLRGKASVAGH